MHLNNLTVHGGWILIGLELFVLFAWLGFGLFRLPLAAALSRGTPTLLLGAVLAKIIYQLAHHTLVSPWLPLKGAAAFLGILFCFWILWPRKRRQSNPAFFCSVFLSLVLGVTWVFRSLGGYSPDGALAWFGVVADLTLFGLLCLGVGSLVGARQGGVIQIGVGLSTLILISTLFTALGFQRIWGQGDLVKHFLLVSFALTYLFKSQDRLSHFIGGFRRLTFFQFSVGAVIFLPFVTAFNLPVAPDADSLTQAEFVGYLFQGKMLSSAASGVPGEFFHFRYPPGMASLSYIVATITNTFGPQSLALLLGAAYFGLFCCLARLCRSLKLSAEIGLLFLVTLTLLGWQGVDGGHGYQMLAYGLGIVSLILQLDEERSFLDHLHLIAILLCAGVVINPFVMMPFFLVLAVNLLRSRVRPLVFLKSYQGLIALGIGLGTGAFLYFSSIRGSLLPTQPGILLGKLTGTIFLQNIAKWLMTDFKFPILFLILLALPFLKATFSSQTRSLIFAWFMGEVLLDGLFGHTEWMGRFYACFGLLGVYALCAPLMLKWTEDNKGKNDALVLRFFLVGFWILVHSPWIPYNQLFSLTTYDDVRMGEWIAKNTPKNALICNATAPGVAIYYAWAARANSARDTVYSRINDHQIKTETRVSRKPYGDCLDLKRAEVLACLARLHVDYLWIMSSRNSDEIIKNYGNPIYREGLSVLYRTSGS